MTIYKIQLMAYGEQDYFLTGNPQISFFKKIYRRHTHFSREKLDINFVKDGGTSKFGNHFKAMIPRKGELLSGLSLEIDITCRNNGNSSYTVNSFTNSLIKYSRIKINEHPIEEYISQWRQIKHELTHKSNDEYNYMSSETNGGKQTDFNFTRDTNRTYISSEDMLVGFSPIIVGGSTSLDEYKRPGDPRNTIGNGTDLKKKLFYNFDFWFTRNIGMALPIVCLYNNEIMLEFDTEKKEELIGTDNINTLLIDKMTLKGDFIHLYGDEKRRFTNSSHEYLIEQLQYKDRETTNTSTDVSLPSQTVNINNFSHPIKYITWAVQNKGTNNSNKGMGPCYFVSMTNSNMYGNDGTLGSFNITLEGYDSYRNMPMIYFTRHNTKKLCGVVPPLDRIGLFSFCLNPFDSQPSGTCNMSKIRDKKLQFVFSNNNIENISNKKFFVFAVNYNVLKINSNGMGGLLFH